MHMLPVVSPSPLAGLLSSEVPPAQSRQLFMVHPDGGFGSVSHVPGKGPVTVVAQAPTAHGSLRTGRSVGQPEEQPPVTLAGPGLDGAVFNCLVAGCHLRDSVG